MEGLRKEVRKLVEFPAPDIQWAKFNDGFPDVFVEHIEGTRGNKMTIQSFGGDAVLCMAVMLSAPPRAGDRVRYVCARCGLGSDRTSGREPCPHCGLFTRIEWGVELPESCEEGGPLTRVWCPKCGTERAAPRGTSACGTCGERLHIEFNDHATGASAAGDGRGLETR